MFSVCVVQISQSAGTLISSSIHVGLNGFKLREGRFRDKEGIFYSEGGEMLERVAQRGSGSPIAGNLQGQAGPSSEQPHRVEDVPARCRGVRLDDPFQPKAFYGSIGKYSQEQGAF